MGQVPRRRSSSPSSWMGIPLRHFALGLLTVQYTMFALILHYSRVMPLVHGQRYLPSTAVLLNEIIKLTVCLTVSLYEVSKTVPASMPATSLFHALSAAIFSGDSWKLAIPASLYTLANSLQYIGLSNLEAANYQVTSQLKLIVTAIFGIVLLRRTLSVRSSLSLLLLIVGVAIVQLSSADPRDPMDDEHMHLYIPQTVTEWREMGGAVANNLRKRSATYQGIEDDLMMENPRLDPTIGLLATMGSCIAAGLAGVYFEKVIRDSSNPTSLWIRNVQLAIYSIVPALFIGVVFLDGEKIAKSGFFEGYNEIVWAAIGVQALGGIATAFCINYADQATKNLAAGLSVVFCSGASFWFLGAGVSGNFVLGSLIVLVAIYLYTDKNSHNNIFSHPPKRTRSTRSGSLQNNPNRPPPIHINGPYSEKSSPPDTYNGDGDEYNDDNFPPPKDFSIKLPTTPLISEATGASRPGSPSVRHHSRMGSLKSGGGGGGGYFGKMNRDD